MHNLIQPVSDGALLTILDKRGRKHQRLRLGKNMVHAYIRRKDGSIEDLGIAHNLLTNTGRDLWAAGFGQSPATSGVNTSVGATSLTDSGAVWATDGYKGWRVYSPVTNIATGIVYGNVGSNTGTVLTIDQWWTAADGVGTTPAAGNSYIVYPVCIPRFMGLTTNTGTPSASDTVLTGEITSGGCARAKATYAHTPGAATYTMQVVFAVTSTFTNIHKMALFSALNPTAAGVMALEAVLNQDATVGNGDTLTVTDTITLSG
jgi:hypothetical protein